MVTREDLQAARAAYDTTLEQAERDRAAIVVQAIDEGMQQKDVIDAMGYSRETVRRITETGRKAAGA